MKIIFNETILENGIFFFFFLHSDQKDAIMDANLNQSTNLTFHKHIIWGVWMSDYWNTKSQMYPRATG